MLGHSRSHSRHGLFSKASAPVVSSPSHRRVTRSQSREVEDLHAASSAARLSGRNDVPDKWGQNKALTSVAEESPVRTPQKTVSLYASSRYSSAVPGSPDDVVNISGTTLLQSEPGSDLEPEMMLEVLPDLERAGRSLLDFLAPSTASPVTIVNKAKILSDPSNTQSRRLRRLISNLSGEFKYFGNQTYLDADAIGHAFTTALAERRGSFQDWMPDPVVHLANCARFAHEILLAGAGVNSRKQVIREIELLFPSPFMSGLVADGQEKSVGESSLQKDTFDLALNIRTQSLLLQLEERQDEPGFSAKHAVRRCFFVGSSRKTLRGFNLRNFGGSNGALPDDYTGTVQDRYNDILLAEVEDGIYDLEDLKGAHRWQRFVLHTAQWIRKRIAEIDADLKNRMSAKAVHDAFFTSKQPSFASTLGGSESEPNGGLEVDLGVPQQETFEEETTLPVEPQQDPRPQSHPERRRSSKPSYLNSHSINRLKQRQERLRAESEASASSARRQSDLVPPVSQRVHEPDRRKTSTALPASQLARPSVALETLAPRIDSPLFVTEEPQDPQDPEAAEEQEISFGEELNLNVENEGTQIESSHSPRVVRSTPSARPEHTSEPRTLTDRIWNVVKGGSLTQPAPGPTRMPTTRFIDRQENAERVSPISQRGSQNAVERVEERVSRKRARSPNEADTSSDDDFDSDVREIDLERRRAEKPQQGSKRRRVEEEEDEGTQETTNTNANVARDNNGIESPRRSRARARPAHMRSLPRKSLGSRVFWTEAEDNRLMRLMREHGTSWAVIVRQNEAQPVQEDEARIEGRDQIKLKDRARNLKVKFYREGLPVPNYFEHVTIKETDRKRLRELGISVPG
ncbi:hypothetical protein BJY01DRAFT_126103 [Aspergillus pseudoustus]|uniref:Myb-like domain-containing protein n=1 Tax=Aspergillus pseudoustus TaxID=1810923 RepID=A0ABR4KER0_9EURO